MKRSGFQLMRLLALLLVFRTGMIELDTPTNT